jgi:hypothetical protein
MDQVLLVRSAERLEEVISKYSSADTEVRGPFESLSKLIADARAGKIVSPMEWRDVPGAYGFTEGGLQKYADLEIAYAEFKIEITGGESPFLRNLRLKPSGEA